MKARHINDRQFATQLNFLQASIGQPHWPATSRSPQPATVAAESNRAEPGALARGTAKLAHLVGVGVDRLRQHASLAKARRELGRLPDHYLEDIGLTRDDVLMRRFERDSEITTRPVNPGRPDLTITEIGVLPKQTGRAGLPAANEPGFHAGRRIA